MKVSVPVVQYRAMSVDSEALERAKAAGDVRIPLSVSSSEPVEVHLPSMGRVYEVLDHDALDLGALKRGLPLRVTESIADHEPGVQVGRVEDLSVGQDGRLRGMARFGKSQRAQEVMHDVLDGIRTDVSVGYRVSEYAEAGERDGRRVLRATKWMPHEATFVAVPADATVGVGRAAGRDADATVEITVTTAPKAAQEERSMSDTVAAPAGATTTGPANTATVTIGADHSERAKAAATIMRLASAHGQEPEFAAALVERGASVEEAKAAILDKIRSKPLELPTSKPTELNDRETREYSLRRAILAMADGRRDGLEFEVSAEEAKRMGRETMGLLIPSTLKLGRGQRTTHIAGTATLGGNLVFTEPGSFIEIFRNRSEVIGLGATMFSGLQGNVAFPRQLTANSATWNTETGTVSETNVTYDQLTLSPNTLQVTNSYSRQLLVQNSFDVEMKLREDIARVHAIALDAAIINGSGTNRPAGIISYTNVGLVTMGAAGGALTYAAIVSLETTIASSNADVNSMAFLTSPKQRGVLRTTAEFSATNGVPIWRQAGSVGYGEMLGYRAAVSANVPDNLTKGTSTTVCSAVIFGNWRECYIGEWGAFEVIVDPYALKKQNSVEMTSIQFVDADFAHAASFAVIRDAT